MSELASESVSQRLRSEGVRSEQAIRPAVVRRAAVGPEPLDVAEHAELVDDPAAGAVVTFAGVVRDHDGGRAVSRAGIQRSPHRRAVVARWPPRSPTARPACAHWQ